MAKAAKKKSAVQMIVFSRARDIPFNRIRLSDDNVRQTDVEVGLDELTHDIDRREDLVQGLNVRAIHLCCRSNREIRSFVRNMRH
ncbi:hypothetical protein [Rhizobium tropici]|uniref:hypothetical protein n=1 Tax=Rhizobium tropici TaxID=398 RepID=UPI003D7C1F9C